MLATPPVIPNLNTTMTGPLLYLEKLFLEKQTAIEDWFNKQWQLTTPPVYGSVDLRNAGFKLAPIDMNLFPAGFNNLNPDFSDIAITAAKNIIEKLAPNTKNILVIPENHTRNLFYWANIKSLENILMQAGFSVRFGTLNPEITSAHDIILTTDDKITIEPLQRKDNKLFVTGFSPDFILLNNDLSEGIPDILQQLAQPMIPPAELGWSQRLKSEHFNYYEKVASEFANEFQIDPWLIAPLFQQCGQIDFMQQEGLTCLSNDAEKLFAAIQQKYTEYEIPYQPFLIIKADAGTYGMAVMTVRNVDELRNLNRKQRTRMSTIKGGQPVRKVIIQEGVYTFETLGSDLSVAEPVVYLWGSAVVGGFYRVHENRGIDENLNAPGMHFEPIAFAQSCREPCHVNDTGPCQNRFYVYGIIARLSMLAAAREMKDQMKDKAS